MNGTRSPWNVIDPSSSSNRCWRMSSRPRTSSNPPDTTGFAVVPRTRICPPQLGVEAAAAHEDAVRRVDRDVEPVGGAGRIGGSVACARARHLALAGTVERAGDGAGAC